MTECQVVAGAVDTMHGATCSHWHEAYYVCIIRTALKTRGTSREARQALWESRATMELDPLNHCIEVVKGHPKVLLPHASLVVQRQELMSGRRR
jgi:hypothetical protein